MSIDKMDVIIVGGSLAGLMQGIAIKRLGHNVTILEQHLTSSREGQAAGIVTMEHSHRFMETHDLLKSEPYAVISSGVQFLDGKATKVKGFDHPLRMSSWNVLYYRFRANFDGLKSPYCPEPPAEPKGTGSAVYNQGKRVTGITETGGKIKIDFEDLVDQKQTLGSLEVDLAVAADGSTSYLRQILQPHLKHDYTGYVAWRGTVLEDDVSENTRETLKAKTTLHASHQGYIAVYTIPGENGALEAGQRLLNFVWYTNMPAASKEFEEAMTDSLGRRHRHTLPIDKMRPEVWDRQKAVAGRVLPPPFRELIDKTSQPFISAIVDMPSSQPSFFNGKLLFVGDALCPFRPHVASSTNQAALGALLVEKLIQGEISLRAWEAQVAEYAHLTRLTSITWGSWYQFGYVAFFFSEARLRLAKFASWARHSWDGS